MKSRTLRPSTWTTQKHVRRWNQEPGTGLIFNLSFRVLLFEHEWMKKYDVALIVHSTWKLVYWLLHSHLENPFIAIVSYSFDHIDSEGIHQLIVGLSQNLSSCFSQTKDKIVTKTRKQVFPLKKSINNQWINLYHTHVYICMKQQLIIFGEKAQCSFILQSKFTKSTNPTSHKWNVACCSKTKNREKTDYTT